MNGKTKKCWGGLIVLLTLTACNENDPYKNTRGQASISRQQPETQQVVVADSMPENVTPKIDTALLPLSREILLTLKQKDYNALATYAHPRKGIRFSPYAYVDTVKHVKLSARELKRLNKTKKYTWGAYDGSGRPIRMNVLDYFDHFVYDTNFLQNAHISQNDFLGSGNSRNNLKEAYPGCSFTEFYFKGTADDLGEEGMGWRSIRLVFDTTAGKPYLVAIIHDQWTI